MFTSQARGRTCYTAGMSEKKRPRRGRAQPYHHGDLRRALVETTFEVVEREGHEAVVVRDVARSLGVSPAAPFRHFVDRTDLLRAVALHGQERFLEEASRSAETAGDEPLLRFRAMGLAYVRFALRHPRVFRLMTLPEMSVPPSDATPAQRALLEEGAKRNRDLVAAAHAKGDLEPGDPAASELAGIALAYGLARMFVDEMLPREGGEALAEAVIDVLGVGLLPRRREASARAPRVSRSPGS